MCNWWRWSKRWTPLGVPTLKKIILNIYIGGLKLPYSSFNLLFKKNCTFFTFRQICLVDLFCFQVACSHSHTPFFPLKIVSHRQKIIVYLSICLSVLALPPSMGSILWLLMKICFFSTLLNFWYHLYWTGYCKIC